MTGAREPGLALKPRSGHPFRQTPSDVTYPGGIEVTDSTHAAVQDRESSEEISFQRQGPLATVELRRPKALNSLTLDMIQRFDAFLKRCESDPEVQAVLVRGQGEKAFCAGGDVRAVALSGTQGASKDGGELTRRFFYEEYRLNRRIRKFPKPYLALIDGITMGGGVGVSLHGSHRVSGDRTMAAMPETAIGLFPDVGASYALPRMKGRLGLYLALTGARMTAADAIYAEFATHYVPSPQGLEIADALAASRWGDAPREVVDKVIAGYARDPGPAPLAEQREAIDRCFAGDSVEEILDALEREGTDWARQTLETLNKCSPTALKLTLATQRKGSEMSFDACMVMEYRVSQHCMAGQDFYEGIRALLIDKDHSPKWRPARLDQVDDAEIARYFEPIDGRELRFDD